MNNIIVRPISQKDIWQVKTLDDKSGNYLSQWIKDLEENEISDYAFGIFSDNCLVGYCSIGYADDVGRSIEEHPLHTNDSLYLSDVYIRPEYRKNGYALKMCKEALHMANPDNEAVFLTVLYDDLERLYSKLGFEFIDADGRMVKAA